ARARLSDLTAALPNVPAGKAAAEAERAVLAATGTDDARPKDAAGPTQPAPQRDPQPAPQRRRERRREDAKRHDATAREDAPAVLAKPDFAGVSREPVRARAEESGPGGIRTLDRGVNPYTGLAIRPLQPLGHRSVRRFR